MPAFRIIVACFAFIAALVGWKPESADVPRLKYPTWASSINPAAGNKRTQEFLAWAHGRYVWYCGMELDDNGNCVELNVHPCWPASDQELEVISKLTHVQSLSLYGASITDDGLRHLEDMPALTTLHLVDSPHVTEEGLARLNRANPALNISHFK